MVWKLVVVLWRRSRR